MVVGRLASDVSAKMLCEGKKREACAAGTGPTPEVNGWYPRSGSTLPAAEPANTSSFKPSLSTWTRPVSLLVGDCYEPSRIISAISARSQAAALLESMQS